MSGTGPAPFSIRPATSADCEQLCRAGEREDAVHHQALPLSFRPAASSAINPADIRALIDGSQSAILVAEAEGELIGVITLLEQCFPATAFRFARRLVEIDHLALNPSAQQQGVGRALIDAAADWAHQRGITALELEVYESNEPAVALYRSSGFSTQRRRMIRLISG